MGNATGEANTANVQARTNPGDNGKENGNYRDDGDFTGFIQGYWGLYRVYTGMMGIIQGLYRDIGKMGYIS